MVKVSIIMPVYNGAKFIKTSINSVLEQTFKDIETTPWKYLRNLKRNMTA